MWVPRELEAMAACNRCLLSRHTLVHTSDKAMRTPLQLLLLLPAEAATLQQVCFSSQKTIHGKGLPNSDAAACRPEVECLPAPSPMTKPSRSLSQGLLAVVGSSLRLLKALQAMKPPIPDGITAASAEPGGGVAIDSTCTIGLAQQKEQVSSGNVQEPGGAKSSTVARWHLG